MKGRRGAAVTVIAVALLLCEAAAHAQETIVVEPSGIVSWGEMVHYEALMGALRAQVSQAQIPYTPPMIPGGSLADLVDEPAATNESEPLASRLAAEILDAGESPPPAGPGLSGGFLALGDNNTLVPPDTDGAVGPSHVMTMLNTEVRIQNKSGTNLSTISLSTFWTNLTGLSGTPFDPRLQYDAGSGRWIATVDADGNSTTSQVWFAISTSNDPTSTWTFFSFPADTAVTKTEWADFPGLGVNGTWIVITQNMFTIGGSPSFTGAKMWVIDKATALSGGPLTATVFATGFAHIPVSCTPGAGCFWSFAMQPAVTFGASSTLYLADNSNFSNGSGTQVLRLSQITGTGASPAWGIVPDASGPFPGFGVFTVINNFDPSVIGAAQMGTAALADTRDTRISANSVFRNSSLWFVHHAGMPVGSVDRTAVFWYEVDPTLLQTSGMPILQSGVLNGGSGVHHFYPSIAVNGLDDVCVGFSRSDTGRFIEAVEASRFGTDTAGAMGAVSVIKAGEDAYAKTDLSGLVRWGDYSATVIDPSDDLTFWSLQEYAVTDVGPATGDDRWGTWWGFKQVVAPTTTTTTTSTTTTLTATTSSTTTTTVPLLCGAAPEPAVSCRLNAALKGQLQIKDKGDPAKAQLKWKWGRGDDSPFSSFGDPVNGSADYAFCVYEDVAMTPIKVVDIAIAPGGTCAGKPCWKMSGSVTSPKGYSLKDKAGSNGGVTGVKMKAGATGKAQVQIKARGSNLVLPSLGLTGSVTAQLLIDDGVTVECWQTTYATPQKNDTTQYKAKGP